MVSLVHKVLYPMDLKRYMVLSFTTLWTFVLIIALVATLVHQINFQDSSRHLNLEFTVAALEEEVESKDIEIKKYRLELEEKDEYIEEILSLWTYP